MSIVVRHLLIGLVPLILGVAAGLGFSAMQESCGGLVGFVLAAKCRGVQLEYQMWAQMGGTAIGGLLVAWIGARWELAHRRDVQRADSNPGESS
jgi:hypothetical protein